MASTARAARGETSAAATGARTLTILTYHSLDVSKSVVSVTPQDFAAQMACLVESGFRGISLREALLHRDRWDAWPEKCVALTFDDGYENFFESAFPMLVRHGFTATVFVVSGHVGKSNDWAPPPAGLGSRAILSWQQITELSAAGIEIGSHTATHPDLRRLPLGKVEDEIVSSRDEIAGRTGKPVESFAYPFGLVSRGALEIVRREFRAACTTTLRRAGSDPLHSLPRIDMYYAQSPPHLKRLLSGRLDAYLGIRRWGRAARSALLGLRGE